MKRVPVSEIFDIPKFYYFESKNIYTGSKGNFNYKIIPGETLVGQVWHGKLCSMKATIEQEQSFSMTQEGFDQLIAWLEQCYKDGSTNNP